MKKQIRILIKDYKAKVCDCETIISDLEEGKKEARNEIERRAIINVISINEAKKQAYTQALKDIESILFFEDEKND